jgi:hypothetical protein
MREPPNQRTALAVQECLTLNRSNSVFAPTDRSRCRLALRYPSALWLATIFSDCEPDKAVIYISLRSFTVRCSTL